MISQYLRSVQPKKSLLRIQTHIRERKQYCTDGCRTSNCEMDHKLGIGLQTIEDDELAMHLLFPLIDWDARMRYDRIMHT